MQEFMQGFWQAQPICTNILLFACLYMLCKIFKEVEYNNLEDDDDYSDIEFPIQKLIKPTKN